MTEYRATVEDMQQYGQLMRQLAVLDLQREQVVQAVADWEQAHALPEIEDLQEAEQAPGQAE